VVVRSVVRGPKGRTWSALLTGLLLVGFSTPAVAQADASSKAEAEALFAAARTLAAAGNYAEACPKFEASEKLDPGVGTMLNLAECYDKLGRTASAWAQYREAMARAQATHATDREEFARERAQKLAGRLSTLTVRTTPNKACSELTLSRDGATLDAAEVGLAIPLDPGKHELHAAARDCKAWSTEIEVPPGPGNVTVEVPALEPEPKPAATTPAPQTQPLPKARTEGAPPAHSSSPLRPIGVGVGAAGLVGVGVGVFFGLSASAHWSDAKDECLPDRTGCSSDALEKRHRALSDASASTIAFIVGGAAVAAGAVLWFTAPTANRVTVGVGPGVILARGRF
jgi:hypothetical protein